jgi:hypothetical protein
MVNQQPEQSLLRLLIDPESEGTAIIRITGIYR